MELKSELLLLAIYFTTSQYLSLIILVQRHMSDKIKMQLSPYNPETGNPDSRVNRTILGQVHLYLPPPLPPLPVIRPLSGSSGAGRNLRPSVLT